MNHTDLLNHLAKKHNLNSYLEIGVQNPANNFNKIICEKKWGVDPMVHNHKDVINKTSDEFFSSGMFNGGPLNEIGISLKPPKFDMIFIDGLHHADQVKRDFENSLRCLNDGGFIVIHDCLPEDEITTCVPRGGQKIWHGDVYKFTMTLRSYPAIKFITFNFDNGCCVVWKDDLKTRGILTGNFDWNIIDWSFYKQNRFLFMNIQEWQPA